jgi:xanthine dehydrogenase YagT iron-sulfur-binding subunit
MPDTPNNGNNGSKVSRRSFLKGVSAGVVSSAVIPAVAAAEAHSTEFEAGIQGASSATITLNVNGIRKRVSVESRATLVSVIRDDLGLTGTKVGCDRGECGCCTVIVDGKPVYSCLTLAVDMDGKEIQTIENLEKDGKLSTVQQAFVDNDAYQCGFCTPGQIMTATAFLEKNPNPTFDEIKNNMSGNICRCGSYQNIFKAVGEAARKGRR